MSKSDKKESSSSKNNKKGISMHEDIPVWYDCCSCEAEPYWVEAFSEDKHNNISVSKEQKK